MQQVQVIAHRGYSAIYPENTMAAFDAALNQAIDGIELDVQMTRDQHLICWHDHTLKRAGGGLKRVRSQNRSDLSALPGPPIPYLDDVLIRYGRRTRLLIELKDEEVDESRRMVMVEVLLQRLRRHGLTNQVFILCFNLSMLQQAWRLEPGLHCVLNQHEPKLVENDDFLYAYSINIRKLTLAPATEIRARGKKLFVFTCNTKTQIKHALTCSADAVMADDPVDLLRFLRQHPS